MPTSHSHTGNVMPVRAPRICGCGHKVASGVQCPCEARRAADRKARADQNRPSARERGYDGKWQTERAAFLKAHPTCKRCGQPATVVDHVVPHRGDRKLFWSRSNWQPLCTPCHSRAKQADEARGVVRNFPEAPGTGGGKTAHDFPQIANFDGSRRAMRKSDG
ncbi:HNH endonuclease signature motif containing protein [Ancylobacter sp. WKF20]|uniref:HNH endonuclease n=1 Tax=Ancylobacter sp. WKF20 TaxID=3039801 RepID=UPI00325FA26A